MILCIDCGNTRLKWGLWDGGAWAGSGSLPLVGGELPAMDVERVIACNVAGEAGRQSVLQRVAPFGMAVEWLHSQPLQCGVVNGYQQPAQLGADRWAALIGARHLHPADCLVVMCGTATTIDLLTADGRFQGGLILPGLDLMREALAHGTAQLSAAMGAYAVPPRNTLDAIATGGIEATIGAIERMFGRLECDPLCLISGGAAAEVVPHLTIGHRPITNLVLEGLAKIASS